MGKIHEVSESGTFLDRNLNFRIKVFTWSLANDLHICKKYKKVTEHTVSNLIQKIIQNQNCESSHNANVLQLD